jgi:chromate transporter
VAVVAQAVWAMGRSLAPDRQRATILLAAVVLTSALPATIGQPAAIVVGAIAGLLWCRDGTGATTATLPVTVSTRTGTLLVAGFLLLLFGLPAVTTLLPATGLALFELFYRAGALVFGGGHVVLPLLESGLVAPGWVDSDSFVAGYGATQAVPGPLFTFAAYLGFVNALGPDGLAGAAIALAGIFLPGMLLVMGVLPFWHRLARSPGARAALAGTNAAVVGLLASALYAPLWTGVVHTTTDFAIAVAAFVLLTAWRLPPWVVVLATVLASVGIRLAA